MRISDWSSDVCSSDLLLLLASGIAVAAAINIGAGSLSPAWADGTFRLAIAEDALTLDPIASSDNASIWTELLIFDQLVRPSKDGTKLAPGLAESWTIDRKSTRLNSSH